MISGQVLDRDGDPWINASVEVYRYVWRNGKHQVRGYNSEPVNDRGEFRIAQLPRGRYFLVATLHPSPSTAKRAREEEQTTSYPNALRQDGATPIPVQAGQELQGIEIRLRKSAVYWIRGKVIGLASAASETTAEGAWRKPGVSAIVPSSDQQYAGTLQADGSFGIGGVPPGSYEIPVSQIRLSRAAMRQNGLGRTQVAVTSHNIIEDAVVAVTQPRQLGGHVRVEGDEHANISGVQVWLETVDGSSWMEPGIPREDGSVEFGQVGAERYQVRVKSTADTLYLKAIRWGGIETRNPIVDLTQDRGSALELLLNAKGPQIQGRVKVRFVKSGGFY